MRSESHVKAREVRETEVARRHIVKGNRNARVGGGEITQDLRND